MLLKVQQNFLEVGLFKNGAEEIEKGPLPHSLSNAETRKWYHDQLAKIPSKIDRGLTPKEQALKAYKLRNEVKLKARELMKDKAALKTFPLPYTLSDVVSKAY